MTKKRCSWVPDTDEVYQRYHDTEWGVPVHDDTTLFEFLILEGAQAGLSWSTILKRRAEYRTVFHGFAIETVAAMTDLELEEILKNPGIIRNRLKVFSVVKNAQAVRAIQQEHGSFSNYLWSFFGGKPIHNHWRILSGVPAQTAESIQLSKDLKKRGCTFVGPTIMYAFMQAVGMVQDHTTDCFRYEAP